MKITGQRNNWSIHLEKGAEALALLAVQETETGNRVLSTTDPKVNRVETGRRVIELLRIAEIALPTSDADPAAGIFESVEFKKQGAQHLSGLIYGATTSPQAMESLTAEQLGLLVGMESQIQSFFGMDS